MGDTNNLYEVLGVEKEANTKEIRQAFRKKAQKTHPDKNGGKDAEFKKVLEAYNVLVDEHRRAHYDATGKVKEEAEEGGALRQLILVLLSLVAQIDDPAHVDLLQLVKDTISAGIAKGSSAISHLHRAIKTREATAARFSVKSGPNVLAEAILSEAASMQTQITNIERNVEIGKEILSILAEYSYKVDERTSWYHGSATSSTSTVHYGR